MVILTYSKECMMKKYKLAIEKNSNFAMSVNIHITQQIIIEECQY